MNMPISSPGSPCCFRHLLRREYLFDAFHRPLGLIFGVALTNVLTRMSAESVHFTYFFSRREDTNHTLSKKKQKR
jgi:hypothetical protein